MAGGYRLKTCPVCGVEHRKRGPYCSRSHAASDRVYDEQTKQKIRDSNKARLADRSSDAFLEAMDNLRAATAKSHGIETTPVPPQIPNRMIDDHHEVIDGDYWVDDGY